MNHNEWNNVLNEWRNYIKESAVDISGVNKIKTLVNRIVSLNELGKNSWIDVNLNGSVLEVKLENYSNKAFNKIYFQDARLDPFGLVGTNIRVEGNRKPYVIKYSEVDGGFGPLLYEIGLEIISCYLDSALMSDRADVSEEAYKVWDRYKRRAGTEFNLEAVKMDFSSESLEDVMYEEPFADMTYDEQESFKKMEKLTPDDKTDDVYQVSAVKSAASKGGINVDSWKDFENPLAYAYYKHEAEIINYIKSLDENLITINI